MGIDLTGKEICNIIKACKETGVTELKLGTLQLNFGKTPESAIIAAPLVDQPLYQPQSDQTEEQLQLSVMDENVLREQFFAQQMIDDPVGFETTIADGFLEEGTAE